ncbi:MAG: DciA family protein [Undibacterium sp.]|nr:DciA family protein [Undibacterium sp.]MDO9191319.1 DciA family protein [Undibacterium sp.]
METSSRHPYRINIKRGKKLFEASGIATFLTSNDKISPLLPTIRRNASLQKECRTILPAIFDGCEILQLAEEQLTLSTPNAALASKLKQQLPKLQSQLQLRGWQINAIRIKVQVKKTIEKPLPIKQLVLSDTAVRAFDALENALEDTPQNDALKAALHRLVMRRHQHNNE